MARVSDQGLINEIVNHNSPVLSPCIIQSIITPGVLDVHISALVNQVFHSLKLTLTRCNTQGCSPIIVLAIDFPPDVL